MKKQSKKTVKSESNVRSIAIGIAAMVVLAVAGATGSAAVKKHRLHAAQDQALLTPVMTFASAKPNYDSVLTQPWDSAAIVLPQFLDDPRLHNYIKPFLAQLPQYREVVQNLFHQGMGLRIDVINQEHTGYEDPNLP